MECSDAGRITPDLMLAARITLPHFSVSSAMSLSKSAGEPGKQRAAEVDEPCLQLRIGESQR